MHNDDVANGYAVAYVIVMYTYKATKAVWKSYKLVARASARGATYVYPCKEVSYARRV